MAVSSVRAQDFLKTLGVGTHIPYTDGGYVNITNVIADLKYLGVFNVRDGVTNGGNGSAPLASYAKLAQGGIKFTVCLFGGGPITTADLQSQLALVAQLNAAVPGSVIAVEGPNEINNEPITYNGVGGLQGAINLQQDIYSAVKGNPALKGVSVDYFTGYAAGSVGIGPNPQTTAGLADFDTQHPYPNYGQAPYQWVNRIQAFPNESPPTGPAVYTETGYSTNGGTGGAVNADVQAKYSLDLLMDTAQSGIAQTYLYQLMDAYQPGSRQGDDGFGLFDPNNQPKEAALAIHDLTAILADPGATATSFSTTAVNYTIANLSAVGNSMELQKSNGVTEIVVWNEPQIWNQSTGTETQAPITNATISLDNTYQTIKVFDPLQASTAIQTFSNTNSLTLALTDHPLIVEIEPGVVVTPTPTPTPVPDTVTLRMSEDAYKGDAQFLVRVDGNQLGTLVASALHATGDSNVFTLTGNWGQGVHHVQIQFLNDLYAGTPSTDRNLYVSSIAYDGTTYAGTSAAMLGNGNHDFNVGGATATAPDPADTLTVHLSEDAWQGDAQFTLAIDGKQISTPQSVTTTHSSGQWKDFAFAGNFGAGTHTIGVTFTNDAYGGSPSTDRNLYVGGIDFNGQHNGSGVTTLLSNGTATFTVVASQ